MMIRENIPRGRVVRVEHESQVLRGNPLGDATLRDIFVYLPHGYDESSQRYPVVYALSGFTGRGQMMLNDSAFSPTLAERLDRLIAGTEISPVIAVLPDCFTYYGGSQYINSTATGRYEDYVADEIVGFIDNEFRTLARPGSRAVMGKSSGGYGALVMGMRRASTFGLVCSIAGDAYFEYCYPQDFAKAFRAIDGDPAGFMERVWSSDKGSDHAAINTIGMSACYSPRGSEPELPFDLETGEIRQDVWERWLEHDPVRLVDRYVDELKAARLIFLDAGRRDEFHLDIGARILSRRFTELGIRHIQEEFDGGHFGISYRFDRSLRLISEHLELED